MTAEPAAPAVSGLPSENPSKSYWHKEPSEKLLGHRTTAELPEKADVVIVGSGMTGAWAAHFLKNGKAKDQSVVMLEAREACWGATGRNGGHCQPFLYAAAPEVANFELETYNFLRTFVEEHNIDCSWRTLSGVHVAITQNLWEIGVGAVEFLEEHAPDLASKLTLIFPRTGSSNKDDWCKDFTLENLRVPNAKGAIVQRHAASMWPYKLVCWVLENLLKEFPAPGFNIQTTTPVTAVGRQSGDAAYPWTVETPRGKIAAHTVLLAANGYTSHLLPAFADLIVPVRAQIGALLPPDPPVGLDHSYVFMGETRDPLTDKPDTRDEYMVQRPLPTGELIFGGGRQCAEGKAVGEWRDDAVEEKVASFLRSELEPVLNLRTVGEEHDVAGQELKASFEWTGIMGYSLDQTPWVGPVPESLGGGEGLFMCAGYTGHGMPHAALCARAAAYMIMGEKTAGKGSSGYGVPKTFVVTEERAARAREAFGSVKKTDDMGLEAFFATLDFLGQVGVNPETSG